MKPLNPTELRNRAAWYREYATQAGNSRIAESRLQIAEELEAEADRVEVDEKKQAQEKHHPSELDTA